MNFDKNCNFRLDPGIFFMDSAPLGMRIILPLQLLTEQIMPTITDKNDIMVDDLALFHPGRGDILDLVTQKNQYIGTQWVVGPFGFFLSEWPYVLTEVCTL